MVPEEKPTKLSMSNTKKEMLDEYQRVAAMLREARKNTLRPENAVQEKKEKQSVERADAMNVAGVEQAISVIVKIVVVPIESIKHSSAEGVRPSQCAYQDSA